MADLFFQAICFAVFVATLCMSPRMGERSNADKTPPNFKPGSGDSHSTRRGVR